MHTQKPFCTTFNIFRLFTFLAVGLSFMVFFSSILAVDVSAADPACPEPKTEEEKEKAKSGIDPQCVKTQPVKLTDEQAKKAGLTPKSADNIVTQTLNGVYGIVAIIATITIVLAGIRFITADGDASKIAAARQTIIYAVVGLAIVGSAFIITGVIQGVGTR